MSRKFAAENKGSADNTLGFDGKPLWLPQKGPQVLAATCPVDIVLFGGARGGGKTDCAIGRQINGCLKYGSAWNGLFLRKNFKHFAELRRRVDELIARGLPAQRIGGDGQTNRLKFSNGAMVLFTAIERADQLEFFQGQQMTEISIEEGCQFPFFDIMVEKLKGCMRSPHGVPCRMFITANPGGPGHNQVKTMFKIGKGGVKPGTVIVDKENDESIVFIPSRVEDNVILCTQDPKYVKKLRSIKDPKLRAAWLEGDWDVVAGGFFDDVWNTQLHVLPRFMVPDHWPRMIGLDWGTAKPFSVGWYCISGGEYIPELQRRLPRGAIVRYREWYGCVKGTSNVGLRYNAKDVARKILAINNRLEYGVLDFDVIADPAIFKVDDGPSIAEKMAEVGLVARRGDNRRVAGWDEFRARLVGDDGLPTFYVTSNCEHFLRTIPTLSRDENDWDDVDSDMEDHIADETRYVLMSRPGDGISREDALPAESEVEEDFREVNEVADTIDLESAGNDEWAMPACNQ